MKDQTTIEIAHKAIDQLLEAASAFMHQQVLIQSGDIGKPADVTKTTAYLALKDARTHARFVLQSGALGQPIAVTADVHLALGVAA